MKKWDVIDVGDAKEIVTAIVIIFVIGEIAVIAIGIVDLMGVVDVIGDYVLGITAVDVIILYLRGCFGWLEIWQDAVDAVGWIDIQGIDGKIKHRIHLCFTVLNE